MCNFPHALCVCVLQQLDAPHTLRVPMWLPAVPVLRGLMGQSVQRNLSHTFQGHVLVRGHAWYTVVADLPI